MLLISTTNVTRVIFIIRNSSKTVEYKKSIKGKRISVCGIGVSNLPLIDFLLGAGAVVTARDMKDRESFGQIADDLEKKGVRLICGEKYLDDIDDEIIFRTPGIRFDKKGFVDAVEKGALLTSEMQVFFELCPCKIIGVTGSDGKTTTTTLISEILKASGKRVWLGGNIGKPLLPDIEQMSESDFAVVELSSFQLHTMKNSPDIAVVTNISPNHLDYHVDYNEYIDAKKNIYRNRKDITFITNAKNDITLQMADECKGKIITFSAKTSDCDVYEENGYICKDGKRLLNIEDIILPGKHNVENYMAAIGATLPFADTNAFEKIAKTFKGVEHRLEFVGEKDGVKYYNSSIDSTPTRTMAALSAFKEKNLIVICGGYDKNLDYAPLVPVLAEKAKCVVLTGACKDKIKNAIDSHPFFHNSSTTVLEENDFEKAVMLASSTAKKGDIVLLSPAAASFDAFKNFMTRGRFFKDIVGKILQEN